MSVRRGVSVACACVLAAAPLRAAAQVGADDEGLKGGRRFLFALVGAVVGGVPAYLFAEERGGGVCTSRTCLTALGVTFGGTVGFLIGLEQDHKHTRQMRRGPTLAYRPRTIPLGIVPEEMVPFGSGAVVTGIAGASLVYPDGRVLPRARGIRGIEDAAVLESQGLVVFATGSGLLAFPVAGDTVRGALIDRTGGSALEAVESELAVGGVRELRWLRVTGPPEEPSAETTATAQAPDLVYDVAWNPFQRVAWAVSGDRLVAYAPGTLEPLGELRLPGTGLRVRVEGDRAVVAVGSEGVLLVDISDPAAPRPVRQIEGMRFAYAADLAGDRLYVAAGPEGLIAIDISDEDSPRVVGVGRSARFVRDVFERDGEVWVLDREGRKLEIAELEGVATSAP